MSLSPLTAECAAVRQAAGLFDLSDRGALELDGADRASFLHRLTSNDILHLAAGRSMYAMFLTNQAKILADALVVALEQSHGLLLDSPTLAAKVLGLLDQYHFSEEVTFADRTGAWTQSALQGPHAQAALAALGAPVAMLEAFQHTTWNVDQHAVRIIRRTLTGECGYLLITDAAYGPQLRQRLLEAGHAHGVRPVGREALNVLRIEAGIPWYGPDMDETTLQPETGLADAASDAKGCYIGQEIVARIASQGQVQRRLMGLRVSGSTVPQPGDRMRCEGRDVGAITSAAYSPALKEPIALGYLHHNAWEPGRRVEIAHGAAMLQATVSALPFIPAHG